MPIALSDKTVALLAALSREIIEALPPAERRRLAAECRRVAAITEPAEPAQRAALVPPRPRQPGGVLAALRTRASSQHE